MRPKLVIYWPNFVTGRRRRRRKRRRRRRRRRRIETSSGFRFPQSPPLPNTPSWRGAQLGGTQGQLYPVYPYSLYNKLSKAPCLLCLTVPTHSHHTSVRRYLSIVKQLRNNILLRSVGCKSLCRK